MKRAYRVCIVVPPGYRHSHAFVEVAYLLRWTLADLGYDCDMVLNETAAERVNILLGYHLVDRPELLSGLEYIPYQLEQLGDGEGVYSPVRDRILRNAVSVWDYSSENIAFLESKGISAVWLPVGYHACLERLAPAASPDIDVLFYGSLNPRRRRVLSELEARGVRTEAVFGVYAEHRDRLIERSKIVLNMHHYGAQLFEQVRVSYLLNNRVFTISEQSRDNPYHDVPLCSVPYESLVDVCVDCIDKGEYRRSHAEGAFERFRRHYPMVELLGRVLGSENR